VFVFFMILPSLLLQTPMLVRRRVPILERNVHFGTVDRRGGRKKQGRSRTVTVEAPVISPLCSVETVQLGGGSVGGQGNHCFNRVVCSGSRPQSLRSPIKIAFDTLGVLLVAVNVSDRIATAGWGGAVSVLVEGSPLDGPSSLVFGTSRADRHTLFITNLAILRANGIKTDLPPQPSLASIPVLVPGLDLDIP
jgi:hypothetical protein